MAFSCTRGFNGLSAVRVRRRHHLISRRKNSLTPVRVRQRHNMDIEAVLLTFLPDTVRIINMQVHAKPSGVLAGVVVNPMSLQVFLYTASLITPATRIP